MIEPNDPPRIVDPDSGASERLKGLVEQSRADVGNPSEVQKLEARLSPLLWPAGGAPGPTGTATGSAAGAKAGAGLAIKVGAALVIAGASGFWLSSRHSGSHSPSALPTGASAQPNGEALPRVIATAAPAMEVTDAAPTTTPPTVHERRAVSTDSVSESDLLDQAQTSLTADPSRALALAERHRRLFPHGVLVQEREVIAIEALTRLGKSAEAKARAARFLRAFPGSAHRNKIQSLVGAE